MAYDSTKPVEGTLCDAAEMRSQFTGLKDEIDALPTQAQLSNDLVNTQNATVLTVLPQTSANSNGVGLLGISISDPPTQSEVQNIVSRLDDLINALRR